MFPRRARKTDPGTSHAARRGPSVEDEIVAVFKRGLWLSDEALCRELPERYGPTVRSARSRLSDAGMLVDTGKTAMSARGRPMIVWSHRDYGPSVRPVRVAGGRL